MEEGKEEVDRMGDEEGERGCRKGISEETEKQSKEL